MKGSPIAFIYYGYALEKIFISTSRGRFGKVQKYQIKKTSFKWQTKNFFFDTKKFRKFLYKSEVSI